MARRYTTRREDAAFILQRYAEATQQWNVGDRCLSYDGRTITTVYRIEGDQITTAQRETMHRSKMRRAPVEVK